MNVSSESISSQISPTKIADIQSQRGLRCDSAGHSTEEDGCGWHAIRDPGRLGEDGSKAIGGMDGPSEKGDTKDWHQDDLEKLFQPILCCGESRQTLIMKR
jgi:hypothetical protein